MSPEADKVGQDTLEIQKQLEEAEEKLASSITDWISAAGKKITNPEFAGFLLDGDRVHLVVAATGGFLAFGGEDWEKDLVLYKILNAEKTQGAITVDWGGKKGRRSYGRGASFGIETIGIFKKKVLTAEMPEKDWFYKEERQALFLVDSSLGGKGTVKEMLNNLIPDKKIYPFLLHGLSRASKGK